MSFTLRDLAAGRVPGIGAPGGGAADSLTPREGAPPGLSSSRFDEEEHDEEDEEEDDEEEQQRQSASQL